MKILVCAILLIALILAGCSSDDNDTTSDASTDATAGLDAGIDTIGDLPESGEGAGDAAGPAEDVTATEEDAIGDDEGFGDWQ